MSVTVYRKVIRVEWEHATFERGELPPGWADRFTVPGEYALDAVSQAEFDARLYAENSIVDWKWTDTEDERTVQTYVEVE